MLIVNSWLLLYLLVNLSFFFMNLQRSVYLVSVFFFVLTAKTLDKLYIKLLEQLPISLNLENIFNKMLIKPLLLLLFLIDCMNDDVSGTMYKSN